uniref:Uncharacterized protein n=1 Tax=Vespula pensylvanica TaxID=30213 RepID=A0A834U508_VESPE|nr:hypothetical protein H0235_011565 [Vespula pensylvanica]
MSYRVRFKENTGGLCHAGVPSYPKNQTTGNIFLVKRHGKSYSAGRTIERGLRLEGRHRSESKREYLIVEEANRNTLLRTKRKDLVEDNSSVSKRNELHVIQEQGGRLHKIEGESFEKDAVVHIDLESVANSWTTDDAETSQRGAIGKGMKGLGGHVKPQESLFAPGYTDVHPPREGRKDAERDVGTLVPFARAPVEVSAENPGSFASSYFGYSSPPASHPPSSLPLVLCQEFTRWEFPQGISKNTAGITQLELLKFGGSAGKFERVNEANIRRVLGDGEPSTSVYFADDSLQVGDDNNENDVGNSYWSA